ncbi:MAG: biotin--[acetyl-CoA-carboxylase] ligase, partial [Leptolyngbya sp. SIO1D8]|nr:biotin--[acetyl-CoA-carboxylase] ligase [Leptolyngbya sp. SIO1D8]
NSLLYITLEQIQSIEILSHPAQRLGVLPELAVLRPQLDLHVFETLPSTNQHAWHLVDQGASAGTVVIARQQTAGRGQWGRTWLSSSGGLYLSLVLEPDLEIRDRTLLTLASAWGIAKSLENLGIAIQIKWPNDLVSAGHKVGGILTETRIFNVKGVDSPQGTSRMRTAVIGVGINWLNALPENAISLRELLPDPFPEGLKSLEDLAAIVLRGILQGYHYWQHQGTELFIAAYQQKLSSLRQTVRVGGHLGEVLGVSLTGDLAVSLDVLGHKQIHVFPPGEITLGYNV